MAATNRADPRPGNPVLAALREPPYRRYMIGNGVSLVGTWMQRIAVGWLAWELTHSPAWVGAISFLDLAPSLLIAPFAGAMADRHDRKRVMLGAQGALSAFAFLMALAAFMGWLGIHALAAAVVVHGLLVGVNQPARLAFIPSLVPDHLLPTAVALNSVVFNTARFIGPAVAGLILARFGAAPVFLIDAFSYLAFISALRVLPNPALGESETRGLMTSIRAGIALVRNEPHLRSLFLLLSATALLVRPVGELLPAFAGGVLGRGPEVLGLLSGSIGLGAIIAGLLLARRPDRDATRGFRIASLCAAAAVLVLSLSTALWQAMAAGTLTGAALVSAGVNAQTLAQRHAPPLFRGRVMSLYGLVMRSVPAIGAVAVGTLAEVMGLKLALALAAGLFLPLWLVLRPGRSDAES